MPRASKNNIIGEKHAEKLEKDLYSLVSSMDSASLNAFMKDFLSDEERVMLSKRLEVYIMLHSELDVQTISTALSVSRETVRTHRTKRRMHRKAFHEIISGIIKRRNNQKLSTNIQNAVGQVATTFLAIPDRAKKRQLFPEGFGTTPKK